MISVSIKKQRLKLLTFLFNTISLQDIHDESFHRTSGVYHLKKQYLLYQLINVPSQISLKRCLIKFHRQNLQYSKSKTHICKYPVNLVLLFSKHTPFFLQNIQRTLYLGNPFRRCFYLEKTNQFSNFNIFYICIVALKVVWS